MSVEIEVDGEAAERLLGRKLNAMDRFLGLARDKAVKIVETELRRRVQPPSKSPQNIQDAPRRTWARGNPVRTRTDGADGIVSLHPHVTSARTPVIQKLYLQLGIQHQLVRKGLWMDSDRFERDKKTGRFMGRKRNHGYQSRNGLVFYEFQRKKPKTLGFSRLSKGTSLISDRTSLLEWASNKDKGTQRLRHTVRITSDKVLIKLIMAPTVKFCRKRILDIFETATKQAMNES